MNKKSPLAKFVAEIKEEKKAERSPSDTLKKIIDDYTRSGAFDEYLESKADLHKYIARDQSRPVRFRASRAGGCLQEQAFDVLERELKAPEYAARREELRLRRVEIVRKARTIRALANGKFMHLRYHVLFDGLHDAGLVRTLGAEELHIDYELDFSGQCDRVIEFDFDGRPFRAVIDYKSIASKYYDDLICAQPGHEIQQHSYKLLGVEADAWMMLYENKDTHDLKIYDRPFSEVTLAQIRRDTRLAGRWVNAMLAGEQPEPLPLKTDWCNWCPWQDECLAINPDRDKIAARVDDDE